MISVTVERLYVKDMLLAEARTFIVVEYAIKAIWMDVSWGLKSIAYLVKWLAHFSRYQEFSDNTTVSTTLFLRFFKCLAKF